MLDELTQDLKHDEGWRTAAYKDHLGYWTIGYGFLVDTRRGGGLPEPIGAIWLRYAIEERWSQLVNMHPWVEDQPANVRRALGNMAYQLGVAGLNKFQKMLAALQAGDRELAANEALDSTWATQTPARAKRVAALMRGEA